MNDEELEITHRNILGATSGAILERKRDRVELVEETKKDER